MKQCPRCRAPNANDAIFCSHCGYSPPPAKTPPVVRTAQSKPFPLYAKIYIAVVGGSLFALVIGIAIFGGRIKEKKETEVKKVAEKTVVNKSDLAPTPTPSPDSFTSKAIASTPKPTPNAIVNKVETKKQIKENQIADAPPPIFTKPKTDNYYHLGPRGGCYVYTSGGKKRYVDRSLCH